MKHIVVRGTMITVLFLTMTWCSTGNCVRNSSVPLVKRSALYWK